MRIPLEKNNPQRSGKYEWIRILDPKDKIYESGKTRLPLERRPFEAGVDQWMTTYQSSFLVRLCFPNIDRGLIAKILTITAHTASGLPVELDLFSLEDFLQLSPWNNEVANGSSLTCLSQFDVGERSDGKTEVPMKKELAHLRFAHGQEIFKFPFLVSGNYIDQASSKLLILGHPFFYHYDPKKICNSAIIFKRKSQVANRWKSQQILRALRRRYVY
jgi:hypothetical protein